MASPFGAGKTTTRESFFREIKKVHTVYVIDLERYFLTCKN
jgi:hypothetical protein